jgi:hypothetical protein
MYRTTVWVLLSLTGERNQQSEMNWLETVSSISAVCVAAPEAMTTGLWKPRQFPRVPANAVDADGSRAESDLRTIATPQSVIE